MSAFHFHMRLGNDRSLGILFFYSLLALKLYPGSSSSLSSFDSNKISFFLRSSAFDVLLKPPSIA